jgi:hypothetical protein
MARESTFVTGRMHESGFYFFCPHCSLSSYHPPVIAHFYLVGYGYCFYCFRHVPIEGGDKKGIIRMNDAGKLYTVLYDAKEKEMTREKLDAILEEMLEGKFPFRDKLTEAQKEEDRRRAQAFRRSSWLCDIC